MKYWRATALVLTLVIIALAGCSHGPADTFGERDAVPILAAKVVQKTVSDSIRAIGRVEAFSTVDVKSQINGQVMQVHFRQGEDVKQGDLLFTIDPRPFDAALRQAEANLAKDRAQYREAAADERRYAVLLKQNVGSRQQYDQVEATRCRAVGLDGSRRSGGADRALESRVLRDSRAYRRPHR